MDPRPLQPPHTFIIGYIHAWLLHELRTEWLVHAFMAESERSFEKASDDVTLKYRFLWVCLLWKIVVLEITALWGQGCWYARKDRSRYHEKKAAICYREINLWALQPDIDRELWIYFLLPLVVFSSPWGCTVRLVSDSRYHGIFYLPVKWVMRNRFRMNYEIPVSNSLSALSFGSQCWW